jgi:hypothetical protein
MLNHHRFSTHHNSRNQQDQSTPKASQTPLSSAFCLVVIRLFWFSSSYSFSFLQTRLLNILLSLHRRCHCHLSVRIPWLTVALIPTPSSSATAPNDPISCHNSYARYPCSTATMDDVLGDDLPLAATRLFDRLNQIPNYTWDKSVDAPYISPPVLQYADSTLVCAFPHHI